MELFDFSVLASQLVKSGLTRYPRLARLTSFILSGGKLYPVLVRRSRWLRALARNADRSQLVAFVASHVNTASNPLMLIGGEEYGGYLVPADGIDRTWIVYSFGVGEDLSFEKGLIDRFDCEVHSFDPTPRAIEFTGSAEMDPRRFSFHPIGVADRDGKIRFYAPRDPRHVSYSAVNIQGTSDWLEMEVRTLGSITSALGHTRIDLLKMNIEGSELGVFNEIIARRIRIPVVTAKLEAPVPFAFYRKTLERLMAIGYRPAVVFGSGITLVLEERMRTRTAERVTSDLALNVEIQDQHLV